MADLSGRVAVITGASRGLGAGLAEEFAERGIRLALCARNAAALEPGDDVMVERVDVRDEKAIDGFARAVVDRFGAIDLWINNAGVLEPIKPLRDVGVEEFRDHIDINLVGVFLGSRAYVRHVRERAARGDAADGVLINISSGAAWKGYAGWSAYCAGKGGVDRLSESLQLEEEGTGLRVYSVAPGVIDTDMQTLIRASTPEDFPEVDRFVQRKRDGDFNTVAFVARHLLGIAFDEAARPEEVCFRVPDENES